MPRVLMSARTGFNAPIAEGLEAHGIEIVTLPVIEGLPPGARRPTPDELANIWPTVDAFCLTGGVVTREALQAGVKLRTGASWVIGTENIDVDAATELGIAIGYGATPENFLGVAEAVVMLAAAMIKRLPAKLDVTRDLGPRLVDTGHMMMNSTVGLIGFGNIGRGVAKRLQGWDCKLIAADPYVDADVAAGYGVELVALDTLLRTADVVSVMVTLTDETKGFIGERELALMKPTSYLINTSRGPCLDEGALLDALDNNRLAGAALDVWHKEPPGPDNALRTHPKVLATSHNVGHSIETTASLFPAAVENIVRGLRGEPPLYLRNPEVMPAWQSRLSRLGIEPISLQATT